MPDVHVDPEDLDLFEDHNWHLNTNGYVFRNEWLGDRQRKLYLHRAIMSKHGLLVDGLIIDHIDRDKLNCRKANLRMVTKSVNGHNSYSRNVEKVGNRYRGKVRIDQKQINTPYFDTEEEAYEAVVELKKQHKVWTE
jgi:hypothetical protein